MSMRGNRAWVLGGMAALAGAGAVVYLLTGKTPKIDENSRVLLIGDSLAVGLTRPLRSLCEEAGVPFRAVALSGSNIHQWANPASLANFAASTGHSAPPPLELVLEEFQPTLVLVSLGTNDEFLGEEAVAAEENDLDELLDQLDEHAEVVWIGVPQLNGTSGAVAMIRETRVPYFPSEKLEIPRAGDGIHPTVAGYAGWAGSLWSWLT